MLNIDYSAQSFKMSHVEIVKLWNNLFKCRRRTSTMPAVVIGRDRIGSMFYIKQSTLGSNLRQVLRITPKTDILLGRNDAIPGDFTGPIFCCVRADAIDSRISSCSEQQRNNFVFIQNGHIEPVLDKFGILESCTRVILFIAIATKDEPPVDGITPLHPHGLTVVCGKWAHHVKARLWHHNLSCHVVTSSQFQQVYYEKLIWLCTCNLLGMCYGGLRMSKVADQHEEVAQYIMLELSTVVQHRTAVWINIPTSMQKLLAYARTLTDLNTSSSEYETRKAYFNEYSNRLPGQGRLDPSPTHTRYLRLLFNTILYVSIPSVQI